MTPAQAHAGRAVEAVDRRLGFQRVGRDLVSRNAPVTFDFSTFDLV